MSSYDVLSKKVQSWLAAKLKSPSTLKNRRNYILFLYRSLDATTTDLSFLNNRNKVMKLVKNSENAGTIKTRLFHIVEMIKLDKDKSIKPDVKKFYEKLADQYKTPAQAQEDNNVMNAKQTENFISISTASHALSKHVEELFKEYGMNKVISLSEEDFDRLSKKSSKSKNIFTFAKALQESVILSLYVWQTALRNDWGLLKITRKTIIPNTGNWLQIKPNFEMVLVLNEYKTSKYFGKQYIPLSKKASRLMMIWIQLLSKLLNIKSFPLSPLYWSINAKGKLQWLQNKDSLARQLPRISKKILNKSATINTFRHAHEMELQNSEEYKRMTVAEKKEAHAKLLHNLQTGIKYNLQRRSKREDDEEYSI